jgi:3-deoxy-manno-octulosonate cytidylyltransferase (CMP-KDO synthetase)
LESRRLPDKPLRKIGGKPLVQWTYERAKESDAEKVTVLCDSEKCLDAVRKYVPEEDVELADTGRNGTERIAIHLFGTLLPNRIVNLQCDEPFIEVADLNRLGRNSAAIQTLLGTQVLECDGDRHTVKAVVNQETQQCYWFSRYYMGPFCYQHIGVYSFPADFFRSRAPVSPTSISLGASLEQLAWIEHGYPIHGIFTERTPLAINTEADLLRMESHVN